MKKLFSAIILLSFLGMAILPVGVFAGDGTLHTVPSGIKDQEGLFKLLTVITDWIFTIFLALAVIFIIIAAFQFITAGGKAESVSEARQKIIWAAVGIIVALVARAIPAVLESLVRPIT